MSSDSPINKVSSEICEREEVIVDLCDKLTPKDFVAITRERFPDAEDFLSPDGLEKEELIRSMLYLSVATNHSIKMTYPSGHGTHLFLLLGRKNLMEGKEGFMRLMIRTMRIYHQAKT